ncbi:FAD binding domain-containing protein [Chloroflexota bacterium]
MKTIKEFDYLAPRAVIEAVSLLRKYEGEARLLAGGTDLVPLMKDRVITPKYVIDMKQISSLDFIRCDEKEGLSIGTLTTIAAILDSDVIREGYYSLYQAAKSFATTQVRNMATIGGNICSSCPSSDMIPPLLSFDAKVKLVGVDGERTVPLEDFFTGPARNVLNNEILTEIKVPPQKRPYGTAFKKVARTSEDLAKVNCAVRVVVSEGKCEDIRIALGGVAPTPVKAKNVEQALKGSEISAMAIDIAIKGVIKDIAPITDCRANVGFRAYISQVLIKRLTNEAIKRLGG